MSGQKKLAIQFAKSELAGVGTTPSLLERHDMAFHYRRSLTDAEIATLDQRWCAIPPRDLAGEGEILEQDT
jgi:hypothetical protein